MLRLWVSFCLVLVFSTGTLGEELWDEDIHPEAFNPDFTDEGLPLIELDIVYSEDLDDDDESDDVNRRFAMEKRWPLGEPIKFLITPEQEHMREKILAGIDHWMMHTCVEFVEVPADFSGEPHLRFISAHGCWSFLGRLKRPQGQPVSIGMGCGGLPTVAHEIAHALGFHHEISRADRDDYVEILFDNIAKGKEPNFTIRNKTNSFNVPYDLTSIQHYGAGACKKGPGLLTIMSRNPVHQHLVGRRPPHFTHRDKTMMNRAYECSAHCESPPACQNEGYVDKNCACVCPEGITGANCEHKPEGWSYYPAICGDDNITEEGTIKSPGYPEDLPTNSNCYWRIFAPDGQRVQVTFAEISMNDYPGCSRDRMMIALGPDVRHVDQFDCGDQRLQDVTVTSVGNEMMMKMRTKGKSNRKRRFVAEVVFVPAE